MTHPAEEYRQMKAWKIDTNMLGCVTDAECGILTRCPCGGGNHQRGVSEPENDGFHFRQPWVFGVQEEVEMLRKRVDAMAAEIAELKYNLTRQNPTTP
ncbi:hypothetical protein IGI04_015258 [Brassica rapa subsp. trilocularis]|uniref:Uncharacterized protein n=1 Tax=Brassica rapa subsp. trilocularis TaxID=1813537 RepID=A0ABQ7MPI1_BRACM|nr:hypothetical protein IGI04_015258 [Brassica rapa subsp. trilocularis]